ncbi:hypothetical protein D3C78_1077650 [compost metagenome]
MRHSLQQSLLMRLAENFQRELMPSTGRRTTEMVKPPLQRAALTELYGQRPKCPGDARRRGRAAVLVGYHAQLLALAPEAQHGLDEVVAVGAKHPTGAQDNVTAAIGSKHSFAPQLAGAVYPSGSGRVGFPVRFAGIAGKHVVGGNVEYGSAQALGSQCQMGNAIAVHRPGPLRLALGLVHRGIGGGVDDQLRLEPLDQRSHLLPIGNIQLFRSKRDHIEAVWRQTQQFMPDLAAGTRNQHSHAQPSRLNNWRRVGFC